MPRLVPANAIDPAEVATLLERSRPPGGEALSEHKAERVGGAEDVVEVVAIDEEETATGYAQAAWHGPVEPGGAGHWAVEAAVPPDADRATMVPALMEAVRERLPERDRVVYWARTDDSAAALAAAGYRETRRLLELARELPHEDRGVPPEGIELRTFRPGRDDAAWLELNNLAFAGHPENGALTQADLDERMARSWFDPDGFLMAWEGKRLVGSCWTKMHEGEVGEIYIIAVHPDARGRGIGGMLLAAGLEYLSSRGATRALLYTEADNSAGLKLYRSAGFAVESVNRVYEAAESVSDQPKR